jgi:tetratricopeptide (TPR) repeat protein
VEKSFENGREGGRIASRLEPGRPDGYFWFGANLGELAKRSPVTVGIKSIEDIREAMTKVTELDPSYQNASAFDALGQLELQTRLYGGKADKAVEFLEKGLSIDKENANIHLHLAEAYLAVKRDADARRQIDQLMQMKPNPDYATEHEAAVAKAKKLLSANF